MEMKDFKFRASSMGDVMTGVAKNWSVDDSLTCKKKLIQMFREKQWKRRNNQSNKYVEKGLEVEESSIDLYCSVKKEFFKKNDIRLTNDYFTGELDLYKGEEITKAIKTIDIKSSWDWTTFPSMANTIVADYKYQGHTYMDLTGALTHSVAYCLVNTPGNLIMDEKRRLAYKMGVLDNESPEYISACVEIEKNSIYDMSLFIKDNPGFEFHSENWDFDIPKDERVHEVEFNRNEPELYKMKTRVIECRDWMKKFLVKN